MEVARALWKSWKWKLMEVVEMVQKCLKKVARLNGNGTWIDFVEVEVVEVAWKSWKCSKKGREAEWQWHLDRIRGTGVAWKWKSWKHGSHRSVKIHSN